MKVRYVIWEHQRRRVNGQYEESKKYIGDTYAGSPERAIQNVCRRTGRNARGYEGNGYEIWYAAHEYGAK